MQQQVTILGATGSIGQQTLSVLKCHPEQYKLFALCAYSNVDVMYNLCLAYKPRYVVMADPAAAKRLQAKLLESNSSSEVLLEKAAISFIVQDSLVDIVVSAMVGAAGLCPTMAAITAGKKVLLANKESLVMAGHLMLEAVQKYSATLLPIDSEHNAIFQSLPTNYKVGSTASNVKSIILTASGGPLRSAPLDSLKTITPKQALAHPTWNMGPKISIDSATMMNKGLEVIEAYWLFNTSAENIEVVIHPQSIVHSLVRYCDGSLIAQLGEPDMRIAISYALAWPNRISSKAKHLDLIKMHDLQFLPVDYNRYPCLQLAFDALASGPVATIALNAANEVAVLAYLAGKINFSAIYSVVADVLAKINSRIPQSIDDIVEVDVVARSLAESSLARLDVSSPRN